MLYRHREKTTKIVWISNPPPLPHPSIISPRSTVVKRWRQGAPATTAVDTRRPRRYVRQWPTGEKQLRAAIVNEAALAELSQDARGCPTDHISKHTTILRVLHYAFIDDNLCRTCPFERSFRDDARHCRDCNCRSVSRSDKTAGGWGGGGDSVVIRPGSWVFTEAWTREPKTEE